MPDSVHPDIRQKREAERRNVARTRIVAAAVLGLVVHAVGIPLVSLVFTSGVAPSVKPQRTAVKLVQVPSSRWGAARKTDNKPRPEPREVAKVEEPKPPPEEPKESTPPGQVVTTAPGNNVEDPNAKLLSETANRVEKETLARDRSLEAKVAAPRPTAGDTSQARPEVKKKETEPLAIGTPTEREGNDPRPRQDAKSRFELPKLKLTQELDLKAEPDPQGFKNRVATAPLDGNSDRLRIAPGAGDGEEEAEASVGGRDGSKELAVLTPSAATLDKIAGAPFADRVEGVEEGEATFLNTREFKYSSFFNRVKQNVAQNWDAADAFRRRDPTGAMYGYKDYVTLIVAKIDREGRLSDIYVERPSGLDFLDREAIAAFERAQPFPNPPRGLLDEEGQIVYRLGFMLEAGRPQFRLFRR